MEGPQRRHGSSFWIVAAVGLALLTPAAAPAEDATADLDLLVSWMTGSFSSAAQAADDPEFFDLSLHVVPIWPDRSDGRWMYVEQAVAEHEDRPYRQRVHRVRELVPGLFESQIFTVPIPAAAIGAWLAEDPLTDLEPGGLAEREGCAILLRRRGETFEGSTLASLCTSTLRGAAYATSELVITPDGVVSWDRGFAADGSQIWGSVRGGYVFDRIISPDPDSDENPDGEGNIDSGIDGKVLFGQNLIHHGNGTLHVGDEVRVVHRR